MELLKCTDCGNQYMGEVSQRCPNNSATNGCDGRLFRKHLDVKLNEFATACHSASVKAGWWHDLETGEPLERNKGELLMLMVSELVEAFEGERKDLMDDKLPHRKMAEVELADCLIRLGDYAAWRGFDLDGAAREKMAYNASREDHKPENRRKVGGKKF